MLVQILSKLPPRRTKQFILLGIFFLFRALLELLAIASIVIFLSVLSDPKSILENSVFITINNIFNLQLQNSSPQTLVILSSILMMTFMIFKNIVVLVEELIKSKYIHILTEEITIMLLSGLLHSNYEWIISQNRNNLLGKLGWRNLAIIYIQSYLTIIIDSLIGTFIFVLLLISYPIPAIVNLALLGGFGIAIFYRSKRIISKSAKKAKELDLQFNSIFHNALNGMKEVQVTGAEDQYIQFFQRNSRKFVELRSTIVFASRLPTAVIELLGFIVLGLGIIFLLLNSLIPLSEILGVVYIFAVSAWRILPLIARMLYSVAQLKDLNPRIATILDLIQELKEHENIKSIEEGKKRIGKIESISLSGLSYTYRGASKPALQNINFSILSGERVGIIGHSGAGKSTLVDVLIGLLTATKGSVHINDCESKNINHSDWIKQIGYVPQSPYFFEGTITENIAFRQKGHEGSNFDYPRIEAARKQAAMHFVDDLKDKLDTVVGERGITLSGGQVQRLAIARALYRNPSLLIFDEATNALDEKTEEAIIETLVHLDPQLIVIIIAHRLLTVEHCDKIIWLENGQIKNIDSPEEIIPQFRAYSG